MMCTPVVLRKTSLVDYPGCVAAVIFFLSCNLRCPWCYNGDLVLGLTDKKKPLEEALALVEKRRKLLGGVVLSGGEPTLFPDLPDLVRRIKKTGFKVKLDTNGTRPEVLRELLSDSSCAPDYIAMDLKLAPEKYDQLLAPGIKGETEASPGNAVRDSARLLRETAGANLTVEFRSLSLPVFTPADKESLAELAGETPWIIRPFIPGNCLDPAWNAILDHE
ncbi:MAG: anaerobic ribonucleoside-triphosphate reductase activating protein [Treponema sp.]|jgi:pyruvate formate lyase activating enzyme|nr:anaerobic ribonucleoside-triphosphate reductase activating protein [Treponema sp.]